MNKEPLIRTAALLGRPPREGGRRITRTYRADAGEYVIINAAAEKKDMPVSVWVRQTLMNAAKSLTT